MSSEATPRLRRSRRSNFGVSPSRFGHGDATSPGPSFRPISPISSPLKMSENNEANQETVLEAMENMLSPGPKRRSMATGQEGDTDDQMQDSTSTPRNQPVALLIVTILISLTAIPLCYFLNNSPWVEDQHTLFVMACGVMVTLFLTCYLLARHFVIPDTFDIFIVFFMVFAFTSVVDIVLTLHLNGNVDVFHWYFKHGEEYLNNVYGFAIDAWDGSAHYVLYLLMIYGLSSGRAPLFRPVYLYWAGSILYSLAILINGCVIGPHSDDLKPSSFLNVPYVILPLFFVKRIIDTPRPILPRTRSTFEAEMFFLIGFCLTIVLLYFRFAVAGGSQWDAAEHWAVFEPFLQEETRFYSLLGYVGLFFSIPICLVFISHLLFGASHVTFGQLTDLACFFAGGMAQTQASILLGANHHLMPADKRPSEAYAGYFWAVNIFLFAFPTIFAIYVLRFRGFANEISGVLFQTAE